MLKNIFLNFQKNSKNQYVFKTKEIFSTCKYYFSTSKNKNRNFKKRERDPFDTEDLYDDEGGIKEHDKGFAQYVKSEEDLKKQKEIEAEMRRKRKMEDSYKCLVLHPVFIEKY
jgi:hypothetical protein